MKGSAKSWITLNEALILKREEHYSNTVPNTNLQTDPKN